MVLGLLVCGKFYHFDNFGTATISVPQKQKIAQIVLVIISNQTDSLLLIKPKSNPNTNINPKPFPIQSTPHLRPNSHKPTPLLFVKRQGQRRIKPHPSLLLPHHLPCSPVNSTSSPLDTSTITSHHLLQFHLTSPPH